MGETGFPGAGGAADDDILSLVDEGLGLLAQERELLVSGQFPMIPSVTARKSEFIGRLESQLRTEERTALVVDAVRKLIAESRRNESMIRAALQGFAAAKRRVTAIVATGKGAVAYAEDGTRISSRADRSASSRQA